jgi:hypothetical protein
MKAKALLAAGLLMAAGVASSSAQTVYSVNAVGFVNVACPPGFSLIANPLAAATNTVVALFPNAASGTQVFKFNPATGGFVSTTFSSFLGAWTDPTVTLDPGEGFFYKNPGATTVTNTFVGNVQQSTSGPLVTTLNSGFNLVSSQVPQQGLVSTDLGLPNDSGTTVFTFSNAANGYTSFAFSSFLGGWTPSEPTVNVGEGFFVKRTASGSWSRTFSVNQ